MTARSARRRHHPDPNSDFKPFYASQIKARPRPAVAAQAEATVVAKPAPSTIRVTSFRPFTKGALRGYSNISWDAAGLRLIDVPVFVAADGKGWCGLPAAPIIDSAGRHHVVNGKKQYRPLLEWRDRDRSQRFSERVIEALLRKFPHALDGDA